MLIKVVELTSGPGTPECLRLCDHRVQEPRRSWTPTSSHRRRVEACVRRLQRLPVRGGRGEEPPLNDLSFVQHGHMLAEEGRI